MRYDALVFDNDGVLTTPTRIDALREAMRRAFDAVGVDNPPDEHVTTLIRPDLPSLRSIAATHDVEPATLWRERERAAIDVQRREVLVGKKTLYDDVEALDVLDRPRAIVSNNQQTTIEFIVEHFGLETFSPCLGREPVLAGIERKKPTPYYLEKALSRLEATNPLYVGDSNVDLAAAEAVGIDVAFLRRPHRDGYELASEPTYEIDSLVAISELC